MPERRSYKETLFDRHGPDAGLYLKAYSFGIIAGGVSIVVFSLITAGLPAPLALLILVAGPIAVGYLAAKGGMLLMNKSEAGFQYVVAGGSSTPYTQQHSYQQALVMQGRLDEALESLEAVIVEPDSTVDVRIRAAELYTREAKKHERAAELFREAIRHPACTVSEEVYCANRLVDLYAGPLQQPGKALVELRRLIDRYPDSAIGERARGALKTLKAMKAEQDEKDSESP